MSCPPTSSCTNSSPTCGVSCGYGVGWRWGVLGWSGQWRRVGSKTGPGTPVAGPSAGWGSARGR
eukprot:453376-Alexandrium_andersonii.AAC.1